MKFNAHHRLGILRLAIGLLQGFFLYWLYLTLEYNVWPATNEAISAVLLMVGLFLPLIAIQGSGNLRIKTLLIWLLVAAILLSGLTYYDIWRLLTINSNPNLNRLPSATLVGFTMLGLFIAHGLIQAGDNDKRFKANYTSYFDVAWKNAIQLTLSVIFVGIFWLVLWLGATLFLLINIVFLKQLIMEPMFYFPANTLAIAVALHITDFRPKIIRGIRNIDLTLISWLLPLMSLITIGFLISLIFTGLTPLWNTKMATTIVLAAAAVLVILINTTYQDGCRDKSVPRILRYSATIAALMLVPLIMIAAYALSLRVMQYGWTVKRIMITSFLIITASYALGYAIAAVKSGAWLKLIETWNFVTTLLILAVLLALLSPIADPARLSVTNQLSRLKAGKVDPQHFDFHYLRWEGQRFGYAALLQLQKTWQGPQANLVRDKTQEVLAQTSPNPVKILSSNDKAKMLVVHTTNGRLPLSFLQQQWPAHQLDIPSCLRFESNQCDVWLLDLNGKGQQEILILEANQLSGFQQSQKNIWQLIGSWKIPGNCTQLIDSLRAGKFKLRPPTPQAWYDLEIMGQRFHYIPPDKQQPCINPRDKERHEL